MVPSWPHRHRISRLTMDAVSLTATLSPSRQPGDHRLRVHDVERRGGSVGAADRRLDLRPESLRLVARNDAELALQGLPAGQPSSAPARHLDAHLRAMI